MTIGASIARWKLAETFIGNLNFRISSSIASSVSISAAWRSRGRVKTLLPVASVLPLRITVVSDMPLLPLIRPPLPNLLHEYVALILRALRFDVFRSRHDGESRIERGYVAPP